MSSWIEPKEIPDFYKKDNFIAQNCGDSRQILQQGLPSSRENRRWKERQKRGKRERVKVKTNGFG